MFHMELRCFSGMVSCVMGMPIRCMCVMSRRFVLAGFVMPGGMAVMFRRALVMRGCLLMVLSSLFRHGFLLVSVDGTCWTVVSRCYLRMTEV
jgi:hypothetical protein